MKPFIPKEWVRMRKQPEGALLGYVRERGTYWFKGDKRSSIELKAPYSPGEVCWVREAIYYNVQHDNFYYVSNHKGCGDAVYHKLRKNVACRQTLKYSPAVMPEIAARRHVRILSCVPEQRGEWGWKIEWEESDAL